MEFELNTLVAVAGFSVFFLFWILIGPLWTIGSVVSDSDRSTGSKATWVFLVLLLGPLPSALYLSFLQKSVLGRFFFRFVLVGVIGFSYFSVQRYDAELGRMQGFLDRVIEQVPNLTQTTLMDSDQRAFTVSLRTLKDEIQKLPLSELEKRGNQFSLGFFLTDLIEDQKLTPKEYLDWTYRFRHRYGDHTLKDWWSGADSF